jgi:hypothetical protein
MYGFRVSMVIAMLAICWTPAIGQTRAAWRNSDSYDRAHERGDPHARRELDAAADLCVRAARDKAEGESGGRADILDVEQPRRASRGGWDIAGRLRQRLSDRGNQLVTTRFSCWVQGGKAVRVTIMR